MSSSTALRNGLRGRCPYCGQGRLFASYLQVAERCGHCTASFTSENSGDGAAAFVVLIVGALVIPLGMIMAFSFGWPLWLAMVLMGAMTIALTLALLPPTKGALVAMQLYHGAEEGQLAPGESDPD